MATAPDSRARMPAINKTATIVLFAAAVVSAGWQWLTLPGAAFGRYFESMEIARNLAAGHGFANPFGVLPTGPTAHLPPMFPVFMAGLMLVFGTPGFVLVAAVLCVLAHALHAVLLPPLAKLVCGDSRPGVWAAVYTILVPTIRVLPQWEAIYAATGTMLFCLVTARMRTSGGLSIGKAGLAGIFCGLLLLLSPVLIIVCMAWIGYLLYLGRPALRRATSTVAAFLFAAILVCLPWTIRNYRELGAVFFIRDNLGLELFTSNADCADASDAINARNGCHLLLQANYNAREAEIVRTMGEAKYNRYRMATAIRWIREHRSRFIRLTLQRIGEFWFPHGETTPVYDYSLWIVTGLSIAGLAIMLRHWNQAAIFVISVLVGYPVIYYFVQSSTRFRFPIVWISLLPAGIAMQSISRVAAGWFRSRPAGS